MGQITIKLKFNKETGKKDILIEYESEEDATGWEHEKRHKRIVEDLVGKGLLEDEELGQVIRVKPGQAAETGTSQAQQEEQPQTETAGQ